jgi:regulator of RNase E activity RraA
MNSTELGAELERFGTPDIADALDVLGYPEQTAHGLGRMWDDCPRVAGRVMPILLGPEESGSTVTGTLDAIEAADPGDVLLFDNGGRTDLNTFGSIAAFCAERAGIKGAVADGASRDIDDMREQNFPLYARGTVTTTVKGRTGMAGYDLSVQCGGVDVEPGDYVVADGSGVIFVPGDVAEDVVEIAPRFQQFEREIKRRVAEGEDPVAVHEDVNYEDFEARSGVDE